MNLHGGVAPGKETLIQRIIGCCAVNRIVTLLWLVAVWGFASCPPTVVRPDPPPDELAAEEESIIKRLGEIQVAPVQRRPTGFWSKVKESLGA